jgi:branched-chain amino acid transport system ATP-binding protein
MSVATSGGSGVGRSDPAFRSAHAGYVLLQAKSVTRLFGGVRAVDGVDLAVRHGSVHGLIGPNGAGKTTLLNLIAGVFPLSAGALHFGARDITRHSSAARARGGIRRTFQNLRLFLEMTALENVAIGVHAETRCGFFDAVLRTPRQRREESGIRERAMQALMFVGLAGLAHARASTLAYGHRRLLEIARAIVAAPQLLLLDEPAAGLNATEAVHVTELIGRLRERGTTIVLVEHHMDVVMSACDEITVLNYGRKLASGTPAAIQDDPAVIEAYLGRAVEHDHARA